LEQTPAPTDTPEPTASPTPEPSGLLKGKFAEKFSPEGVISTETEYRSGNVAIELSRKTGYVCSKCGHTADAPGTCASCGGTIRDKKGSDGDLVTYTLADIYVQDLSSIQTAYAIKTADTKRVKAFAEPNNGILAVNTDYFINAYANDHGWFYRNGVEIRRFNKIASDLCILYADGTMETIDYKERTIDFEGIAARNPVQMWYFGPELLSNGAAKTKFNSSLGKKNPRTVLGYYEPGHYCFMVVDGRHGERGLTFAELSLLCADMGLTAAYNMDGGDSSALYFNGSTYGPDGRDTSDIVYITEPVKENN
jgi:exopolysaccharide biosynthesis protein